MNKMIFILLSILMLAGCGTNAFQSMDGKNSTEAKNLEATKRLDNRNYDAILSDPSKANATDYAAAAMGKAGLDPVDLIKKLNDIASGTIKNDLSTVTSLSLNPDALSALQTAKTKLEAELVNDPTNPDLNFQLVMTSLTSSITAISQVGETAGVTVTDGIDTTEAASIGSYIAANPDVRVDTNGDGVVDSSDEKLVTLIANDVKDTGSALPEANLGTDSELNTVLTDVATKPGGLNYDCTTDSTGKCLATDTVTDSDITKYLQTTFGSGK
ncbi:MAG: hypothetical protein PH343_03555 [Nitrospira sp.]|nr:hypothetical protein [Nitrospira sp.]